MQRTKESLLPYLEKSAHTHRDSRINEEMRVSAQMRQKLHQMEGAAYEECVGSKPGERTLLGASSSSSRGFSVKGPAELNERGSSRRSLDIPPSSSLIDHSACVETCPYTSSADHLHPAIPSSTGHHWDVHRVKPTYQRSQAATSAPNAMVTWRGDNMVTRQTTHTCHHHHYHYFKWADAAWPPMGSSHVCPGEGCCVTNSRIGSSHVCPGGGVRATNSPIERSHVYTGRGGCVTNSPHDLSSHECRPSRAHECPDKTARGPVASSQSKRFEGDEDLYSATVFQAKPSLKHCYRELTPFPSTHGFPFVLCQYCSQLLLLPQGTLLLPPSSALLPHLPLHVKLKCGYCLKISKFSARHLHGASPSPPTTDTGPPSPLPSVQEPAPMPSFCLSDGIIREAPELKHVEAEVPLNEISQKSDNIVSEVLINGNGEHTAEYGNLETQEPPINVYEHRPNQQNSETGDPVNGINEYARSLINGNGEHTQEDENLETGAHSNGECEHTQEDENLETGAHSNGECERASMQEHLEAGEQLQGICGDSSQLKYVETSAPINGKCGYTSQGNNGVLERSSVQNRIETGAHSNGSYVHTSQGKDDETGEFVNGTPKNIIDIGAHSNGSSVTAGGAQHDIRPNREEEITAYSSVQDWVDSLTGVFGYESDPQLPGPINCEDGCVDRCEKLDSSHHRSPLHQHLGYNSPLELFEKVSLSEDEEIKAWMETNSMASSSASSINAYQPPEIKATSVHPHTPSLRGWTAVSTNPNSSSLSNRVTSPKGEEQEAQRSSAGFLKRGLLQKGRLLPLSPKTRVLVNGHVLSSAAVKQAEERAGKLRAGSYWYDCKAGFWGVEGGPCLGILPPFIEELNYPMLKNCSSGDTQVYVNGRELHVKDLYVLSQRGLSQKPGRAYELGFDGVLIDETTGLEAKRLGKLAPTVERRGKGFGMFTAHVPKQNT